MRFKVFKSLTNATQSRMSSNLRCHYSLSTDKKEKECYQLNYDVPSITRHFLSQRGCVEEDRIPDSACRSEWLESLLNCFLRTILKKAEIIISIFRWRNRFRVGKQLTQSHTAYNSRRTAHSYFRISFAISHSFHIPPRNALLVNYQWNFLNKGRGCAGEDLLCLQPWPHYLANCFGCEWNAALYSI